MKKIGLMIFAVAMLLAFSVPASAVITAVDAGSGDALVLPLTFMTAEKNRIALRNNSNEFVQAHIRFRTGIASREVRDFDLIFSGTCACKIVSPMVIIIIIRFIFTLKSQIVRTNRSGNYVLWSLFHQIHHQIHHHH